MLHTANNERAADEGRGSAASAEAEGEVRKEYIPPRIEDFGRIADLTRTLNNLSPGDFAGGSYST